MENKVILVTGASRGIGRAIAKELALEGNIVIANYNKSTEKAQELKNELQRENIEIDLYKADVSKRTEVENMIDYIIQKYKKIDVLVNNAGIDLVKLFTEVTDDDWNYVINNNLYSVFCVSQAVSKHMINAKSGLIINISSIFGQIGASCESIYAVSKAGIDGLTKSLAKELSLSNIRVNSIAPGLIDTEMNNDLSEEDIKNVELEIPLKRIGKTEEIAKTVKMLIECDYITGQVIAVNGGWYM
ncbi:MAG: 3-oxoacyl-ACP reductase FabG [Clostridia bacterium]|nr:3-oxoacyl-ACP reductase FabG [Clostridia bacterium]